MSAVALAATLAACGSLGLVLDRRPTPAAAGATDRRLQHHQQAQQHRRSRPSQTGTLTVETTLPAQGWWNGTTPESIKSGYEYCMAAELANMAGLSSVTVKNVSFDQLVAGHTNDYDIALAEITITPERAKVVDFSTSVLRLQHRRPGEEGLRRHARPTSRARSARRTPARRRSPSSRTQLKCATPTIYPNCQTLYQSVLSGQVDAAFLDTAIVLAEAKATNGDARGRRAVRDR